MILFDVTAAQDKRKKEEGSREELVAVRMLGWSGSERGAGFVRVCVE